MLKNKFFSGIRWKLMVSYVVVTLVTVLTLQGLASVILGAVGYTLHAEVNDSITSGVLRPSGADAGSSLVATTLILLPCIIPFGMIYGFITAGGFTKRMRHLTEVSEDLADGNLNSRAEDHAKDEIGQLAQQFNTMAAQIQTDTNQLHALVEKNAQLVEDTEELAALQERHRLARDLHDGVKQHLFSINLDIAAALNLIDNDPTTAKEKLYEAKETSREAQDEMLRLLNELRPAGLDERGFVQTLEEFLGAFEMRESIVVMFEADSAISLSMGVEEAFYRVVQEAFANISRHAEATQAEVTLTQVESEIHLKIWDNGKGLDFATVSERNTMGLRGIRERVEGIGGLMEIESEPKKGTRILIRLAKEKDTL